MKRNAMTLLMAFANRINLVRNGTVDKIQFNNKPRIIFNFTATLRKLMNFYMNFRNNKLGVSCGNNLKSKLFNNRERIYAQNYSRACVHHRLNSMIPNLGDSRCQSGLSMTMLHDLSGLRYPLTRLLHSYI